MMTELIRPLIIAAVIIITIIVIAAKINSATRQVRLESKKILEAVGGWKKLGEMIRNEKGTPINCAPEEKSLCGMTRLMLPLIKKDFPQFNWDEFRVEVDAAVLRHISEKLGGKNPVIHRTEISNYRNTDGRCSIDAQTSAGYLINERTAENRFQTQITYVQDYQKVSDGQTGEGLTCPNCGAPVKILGHKYCEYCGVGIIEINRKVWKILETREV